MQLYRLGLVLVCCCFLVETAPHHKAVNQDHYDQRQNGTENYRVNVDGVLVAVAPADALLASAVDFEELLGMLDYDESSSPSAGPINFGNQSDQSEVTSTTKPQSTKPIPKKFGLRRRLANLILPILRRNRQQ